MFTSKEDTGFGVGLPSTTTTTTLLMEEFTVWVEMNGFLKPNLTTVQH